MYNKKNTRLTRGNGMPVDVLNAGRRRRPRSNANSNSSLLYQSIDLPVLLTCKAIRWLPSNPLNTQYHTQTTLINFHQLVHYIKTTAFSPSLQAITWKKLSASSYVIGLCLDSTNLLADNMAHLEPCNNDNNNTQPTWFTTHMYGTNKAYWLINWLIKKLIGVSPSTQNRSIFVGLPGKGTSLGGWG